MSSELKDDQEGASCTESSAVEGTHHHSDHRGIDHAENDGDWRHPRVHQGFEILPRNRSGKRSGDTLQSSHPGDGLAPCSTEEGMTPRDAVATILQENFGSIFNEDDHAKEW